MTRPAFECQLCGQCCRGEGGITVSAKELEEIASFLGISPARLKRGFTFLRHGRREIRTGTKGACLFLAGNRCAIHPVKPRTCRVWPFLPGALKEEWGFLSLRQNCPGIDPQADWRAFKTQYEAER